MQGDNWRSSVCSTCSGRHKGHGENKMSSGDLVLAALVVCFSSRHVRGSNGRSGVVCCMQHSHAEKWRAQGMQND